MLRKVPILGIFLSTLSLRRATHGAARGAAVGDFYPRSPCGERLLAISLRIVFAEISIHALLAESDNAIFLFYNVYVRFLSTLSLRRATQPSSRGQKAVQISIHALLAESDLPVLVFTNHAA